MSTENDVRRVLVVDDQSARAEQLIAALGSSAFQCDVADEVPDLKGALGPDSPWDCVLCNADLTNVSWASVRRAMRNFDVQVPVIVIADEQDVDSMKTALGLGATDFFVRSTCPSVRHPDLSTRRLWGSSQPHTRVRFRTLAVCPQPHHGPA